MSKQLKGSTTIIIPTGLPYSDIRTTIEFSTTEERFNAYAELEADLKYMHNCGKRMVQKKEEELQKAGDIMQKEHRSSGQDYKDWKSKKDMEKKMVSDS